MSKKKFLKNAVAKNQCSKFLQSKKIYRKIFEVEKNNRRKNFSADAKQWTRRKKFAICAKRNFTNAAKSKNIIQFRQKKFCKLPMKNIFQKIFKVESQSKKN